jgi:hypothetical protein
MSWKRCSGTTIRGWPNSRESPNPSTYLHTVVNSLLMDYQRKVYGRKRVPKVVERLGAWAVAVFKLICWRGYALSEAYDVVALQGDYSGTFAEFLGQAEPIKGSPLQ